MKAWKKPLIEIDEDYMGSYQIEKNMTLSTVEEEKEEDDPWLPCCLGKGLMARRGYDIDMNPSRAVHLGLRRAGIDFVASVPCVNLQELLELVDTDPDIIHLPATREEEGVGICAGAWMGGKRPALLMQNSGLGNCINALASLDMLYGIPLLMIISHRGGRGESIIGQVPMGQFTVPLLLAMGIPQLSPSPAQAEGAVAEAWNRAESGHCPSAVLLDLDFWRCL